MRVLGYAVLSVGFSLVLQPSLGGVAVAFVLGLIVGVLTTWRLQTLRTIVPVLSSFLVATIVFTADTLNAWAAAGGQAPPNLELGVVALEVRDKGTGALRPGADVAVQGTASRGTPQTSRAPALALDVPAGLHRLLVRPLGTDEWVVTVDSVEVRAGEVTSGRIDLFPPSLPAGSRRTASGQRR